MPLRFSRFQIRSAKRRRNLPPLALARHFRVEQLEDRHLLSASPAVDLNGPAPGLDFAADRANANGLVSIVSHNLVVSDAAADQLLSATATITDPAPGDNL